MPKVSVRAVGRSEVGLVRSNNEDSYLIEQKQGLYAVCDGLGGHAAGEIASEMAATSLQGIVMCEGDSCGETLTEAILEANRRILDDQSRNPEHGGMGTTVSVLWLPRQKSPVAWVAHVGDSRIYRLREGRLEQLTEDHSPVFRLYRQGRLSKDEMRRHPQKNLIERSLGLSSSPEVDCFPTELKEGDRYLLCTDGLSDSLSDEEIGRILSGRWDDVLENLVAAALREGGLDNITIVLLEVVEIEA